MKKTSFRSVAFVLLSVTAAGAAVPGGPAQQPGIDDLLAVTVYRLPEMTRTVRVDGNGFIELPSLKSKIRAAGLSSNEIEREIREELVKEDLLVEPIVSVSIAEYHSRPVTVNGAVKTPILFQAFGVTTLLDAIAQAGGLLPEAGPELIVSSGEGEKQLERRIPVDALLSKTDPSLNLVLTGGENIRVPEAGKVYVVGNVKRPGEFRMPRLGDTTVLKMLALSEGLTAYSTPIAYIYRREGAGSKNEIPVHLKEIVERKAPDISLQANDVFYVPDNKGRRMTMTALDRIVTFGAGTASGVLIWRR